MTLGQRRAHKYIWLTLVVAMPVLIIFSIKDIAVLSFRDDSAIQFETSLPNFVNISENELIKASLYEENSTKKVQIILKSPSKNPSSVVYSLKDNGEKGAFIGQLTAVGIYNFEIENFPKGIVIYDNLKETLITKLTF